MIRAWLRRLARRPTWREAALVVVIALGASYLGVRRVARDGGLARVHDDQIAVVLDHLRGRSWVVTEPGYHVFVPWLQEVHKFDKSPNEYRMEGDAGASVNHAPRLTVRANDGSSFWFESFSLHYALRPERGVELLADSGPGERYKSTLVNAFARAVLRDEFGRYSAEEIVEPDNLQAATRKSQERLNELLLPHSLIVLEIATPKPRFDEAYEMAIERRKVADQEIQHLQAKRMQLEQEMIQREARARKEGEIERRAVDSELQQQLLVAERDAIRIRSDADIFVEEMARGGRIVKQQKEEQAAALAARYTMQAQGLADRLEALAQRGESVVHAALIEKLRAIEISIVPFSRDASPEVLEYQQAPAKPKG